MTAAHVPGVYFNLYAAVLSSWVSSTIHVSTVVTPDTANSCSTLACLWLPFFWYRYAASRTVSFENVM